LFLLLGRFTPKNVHPFQLAPVMALAMADSDA
jgi:hypothetical protein